MKWPETLIIFGCLLSQYLVQSAQEFDVLKYGAKTDGTHKNTAEIAKAIETASVAGGGTVHFPKGTYLTGPIHLRSNVTLNLDDGVLIKFSDDFDDYLPMVQVRWEGTVLMNLSPLIYGINVSHVAITGTGNATLDGSGEKWWNYYRHLREEEKRTGEWNISSKWQTEFHKINAELLKNTTEILDDPTKLEHGFLRPQFFHPIYSDHITLQGVTFIDSPFWNLQPTFSDYIKIDHVTVKAPPNGPNTDGIDPDSCRFVTISNCFISVGDDCVCVKSGRDKQGQMINRPSENITVTDSVFHTGHGGMVIGSETAGSVRNIIAHNLTMIGTDRGIRIKSGRGRGGIVENINISNITMKNMKDEGIALTTYYTASFLVEPISERTPYFHNILIENVTGDAQMSLQIIGLKEKHIENVTLRNVHIDGRQANLIQYADHLTFTNVTNKFDKQ